ncbi:serum basic protease inhibitor-like [Amblyomma americanum]
MNTMTRLPACFFLLLLGLALSHARFNRKKVCSLPKVVGPCKASMPKWWYNIKTGSCVFFIYGGCQGNDNSFDHCEDCMTKCGGLSRRKAKIICKRLEKQNGGNRYLHKPINARRAE